MSLDLSSNIEMAQRKLLEACRKDIGDTNDIDNELSSKSMTHQEYQTAMQTWFTNFNEKECLSNPDINFVPGIKQRMSQNPTNNPDCAASSSLVNMFLADVFQTEFLCPSGTPLVSIHSTKPKVWHVLHQVNISNKSTNNSTNVFTEAFTNNKQSLLHVADTSRQIRSYSKCIQQKWLNEREANVLLNRHSIIEIGKNRDYRVIPENKNNNLLSYPIGNNTSQRLIVDSIDNVTDDPNIFKAARTLRIVTTGSIGLDHLNTSLSTQVR